MNITKDKNGVYYASFRTAEGKRKTITTKTTNLEDAKRVVKDSKLAELEMAARSGRLTNQVISLIVASKKVTVAKAIEDWLAWLRTLGRSENTISCYGTELRAFAAFAKIGHLAPASIRDETINQWINSPGTRKAGTRNVQLAQIRSFFEFCAAKGWTYGDPSRLVEVNLGKLSFAQKEPQQRAIFTDDEVFTLLAETPPHSFWSAAVAIGRWTGLRLSDIACLEWDSLATPGKIIVWTQKKDRRVSLPLEPKSLRRAVDYIEKVDQTYCFPGEREIIIDPKRRAALSVQFMRLCIKCGIEGRSFHCLRHSYCSAQDAAGIPVEHIARSVGHVNTFTTQKYINKTKP